MLVYLTNIYRFQLQSAIMFSTDASNYKLRIPRNATFPTQESPRSNAIKQCRVCLQSQTPLQKIISPCNCSGSVEYVHVSCIKKWIHATLGQKTKEEQNKIILEGLQCEICKYSIQFINVEKIRCKSCEDLQKQTKATPIFILLLSILLTFSLGGLCFTLFTLIKTTKQKVSTQNITLIISIVGLGFSVLFFFVGIYFLIGGLLLESYSQIVDVKDLERKKEKKNGNDSTQMAFQPQLYVQ